MVKYDDANHIGHEEQEYENIQKDTALHDRKKVLIKLHTDVKLSD